MRITSETMVMRSLDRLHTRLQAYERSQSELGTGKKILLPSDDPAGARRGMSLRAALRAREQELRNIGDAVSRLDIADSQLRTVMTRLQRVQELTTRAASQTEPGERDAIAMEIREIRDEIAAIANTEHRGQPLFGGFTAGPAAERDVNGVWQFQGGGDEITRRISDSEKVRVNITAAEWLGHDDGDPGNDLLSFLDDLADTVQTGSPAEVGDMLGGLRTATDRIGESLAIVGAATNRVESARDRAQELLLTLRTELSEVEHVDIAEGVMELQMQQVAYEATLQALAKALPPSLVAFLR